MEKGKAEILRLAKLCRLAPLDLTLDDTARMEKYLGFFSEEDFDLVLGLLKKIDSVDTTAIEEETAFLADRKLYMRPDEVKMTNTIDCIKQNAKTQSDYFVVKKVIE